jgi:hypothetical protein
MPILLVPNWVRSTRGEEQGLQVAGISLQCNRSIKYVSLVASLASWCGMNDLIRHLTSDVRLNAEADSIVDSVSFSLEKRQIIDFDSRGGFSE